MTAANMVIHPGNGTACPLCHTDGPNLDASQLHAGTSWKCQRCGQSWDAARLRAVAAYAADCANRMTPGAN